MAEDEDWNEYCVERRVEDEHGVWQNDGMAEDEDWNEYCVERRVEDEHEVWQNDGMAEDDDWDEYLLLFTSFCALKTAQARFNNFSSYDPDTRKNVGIVYRIEEPKNENVMKTVEWIGHQINITNPLKDVLKAYRSEVPKLNPRGLVIYFYNHTVREYWMDMYAKKKFHIEPWKEDYVDDWWWLTILANAPPLLLTETEEWAESKNYSKVWSHNKTIFYRKHPYSPMYKVKDIEHLHYLHNNTLEHKIEVTEHPRGHLDENLVEITDPPA
ncbi:hypothetical protein WDU94_005834 [Cyamophila willieti]